MKSEAIKARDALWKKMKKEHFTILVPDMLPTHFALLTKTVERRFGVTLKVVTPQGREAKDTGLASIHNDGCYPVIVTAGAFLAELKKGNYDLSRTAVIISQTGGGCRASNYLSLFKKAFAKEYPGMPVLSINFSGLAKEASIPLSLGLMLELFNDIVYGDFLMNLELQARAYHPDETVEEAKKKCLDALIAQKGKASYMRRKANYRAMLKEFASLMPPEKRKPRVGIVGEIYVKYSPYANNHLVDYLLENGVEPTLPSLSEFVLYCIKNFLMDHDLYGRYKRADPLIRIFYRHCLKLCSEASKMLSSTRFLPYSDFEEIVSCGEKVISLGVKMGEGWVIPAEMVDYATHGVENIIVVQPFGCLPNHIVGKGMVRPVKLLCPNANIVPLDFDASSTQVNQENRLRLMLANIRE